MNPNTIFITIFLMMIAAVGVCWCYSVFFKPYYVLILVRSVKVQASMLWKRGYEDGSDALMNSADKLEQLADNMQSPNTDIITVTSAVMETLQMPCIKNIRHTNFKSLSITELVLIYSKVYQLLAVLYYLVICHPVILGGLCFNFQLVKKVCEVWFRFKPQMRNIGGVLNPVVAAGSL